MLDLGAQRNVVEIRDGISGTVHEMHYRPPTNAEIASYQSGLFERKGRKLKNRVHETRVKYGLKILTGFKKGSLGINGKPFSCDPEDPDYRADWKELLSQGAPMIIAAVAQAAFEGTGVAQDDVELLDEDEVEEEPEDPTISTQS